MNIKYFKLVIIIFIGLAFLSACGQDLSRGKAEKLIKAQSSWWAPKIVEVKIPEGDFIPVTEETFELAPCLLRYDEIIKVFIDLGYIKMTKVRERRKRLPSGEEYLTDMYKIQVTDKLGSLSSKTTSETGYYGVFPKGQSFWGKEKIKYKLHIVPVKVSFKEFVKIDSIRDLRQNKDPFSPCDAVVTYIYQNKFTDLGLRIEQKINKDAMYDLENSLGMYEKEGQFSREVCFQLFDDGWKILE